MDANDLTLMRSTVRAALAGSENADTVSNELGADELMAEGPAAVAMMFEELGRSGKASSLLNRVVIDALGIDAASVSHVVFARPTRNGPLDPSAAAVDRGTATVNGLAVVLGDIPADFLVVDSTGPVTWSGLVPARELEIHQAGGLDPQAGLSRVTGTVSVDSIPTVTTTASWSAAMEAARRALASELIGVTRRILDVAIEHVSTREQFGRSIGSFQSVRHRLSESHIDISAAEAVSSVLISLNETDDGDPMWSTAFKASAGRAYESTSRNAIQFCGAMGLTWEHELHWLVRRGAVLNGLLGDARELTGYIGQQILAGVSLPSFDPLVPAGS